MTTGEGRTGRYPGGVVSPEQRRRLVEQAARLFYEHGIAATGTAQLARELRVSKQTLYDAFGSKDGLVTAVLEAADRPTFDHFVQAAQERADTPDRQLVALFEVLADDLAHGAERGCRFLNATAEIPDPTHPARAVVTRHKQSLRRWFERTARRAGLREPRLLGAQLLMLFDGASADAAAVGAVRTRDVVRAAETLVHAARPT